MGIGDYNIYTKQSSLRTGYKSDTDWTLAGSGTHETARRGANLPLEQPLEVQPGDTAAIYIHTTGQHDRGIAYQSYSRLDQRIAGDENLTLYPGQARIGSNPFAVVEGQEVEAAGLWGWYRAPRGLAGAVRYRCRRRRWTPESHVVFPAPFRAAVETVMQIATLRETSPWSRLPLETIFHIFEQLDWRDWPRSAAPRKLGRTTSDTSLRNEPTEW